MPALVITVVILPLIGAPLTYSSVSSIFLISLLTFFKNIGAVENISKRGACIFRVPRHFSLDDAANFYLFIFFRVYSYLFFFFEVIGGGVIQRGTREVKELISIEQHHHPLYHREKER